MAMMAIHAYLSNTPPRMKNSPTKALDPGSASAAMVTNRNATASLGAPLARPPRRSMSSVPVPRPSIITMANAAATTTPWLIMQHRALSRHLVKHHDSQNDESQVGKA